MLIVCVTWEIGDRPRLLLRPAPYSLTGAENISTLAPFRSLRPSLFRHEVGNRIKFTRPLLGSLALRPASLSFRNSRPSISRTPLLRATKAYGQFLGRDFNPLAQLLLLRTSDPICSCSFVFRDSVNQSVGTV